MQGWIVCLDYTENIPEAVATELTARLLRQRPITGWDPHTGTFSLRMTLDTQTAGNAVDLALTLTAGVLNRVYGRTPALLAAQVRPETEQDQ